MSKILTLFVVFVSGLALTLFLFFFYPLSSKEENTLISIDEILKNKLLAPVLGDFPAHTVIPGKQLQCLGCHAASKKDREKLSETFVSKGVTLKSGQIPEIPHEYIKNLNCLSCHQYKNSN